MSASEKPFKRGNIFIKYVILRLVGQGGFSYIYHVKDKDTDKKYALKVESKSARKPKLENEIEILNIIHVSPFFPDFIDQGETHKYRYYVMQLLGPNLTTIRKALPEKKFSLASTLLLSVHMLRCIEEFHKCGYVHRDIKPANFLVKDKREFPLALIDYGLSRNHIQTVRHPFEYISDDDDANHNSNFNNNADNRSDRAPIPPRPKTGFAGTLRYCSLTAHEGHELGRRDDLISWFFSAVELFKGELPWSDPSLDRDAIKSQKEAFCTLTTEGLEEGELHQFEISQAKPQLKLCIGMPTEFTSIWNLLNEYSYESKPDYKMILSLLTRAMKKNNIKFGDKLDWEVLLKPEDKERISLVNIDPNYDYHFYKPDKNDLVPINDDDDADKPGCKCLLI